MMETARTALLRTLAFHTVWGHAPTRAEWVATLEAHGSDFSLSDISDAIAMMVGNGTVLSRSGRYTLSDGGEERIAAIRENELWSARKWRTARRVVRWLARLSSVRFVAVCNTTALGHARDRGDLDFFIITKRGTIMTTRGIAALPFKLLGRRPGSEERCDAICLSYFVTDDGLDLSSHMLQPHDPYFRYWFLSLVPLFDDGVSEELWDANPQVTGRHPFARKWIVPPDLRVGCPRIRFPVPAMFEPAATRLQRRAFPQPIRELENTDTRVMVSGRVLKFHVEDGRMGYRTAYEALVEKLV